MMNGKISKESITKFSEKYNGNKNYKIIANALSKNSIQAVTYNNNIIANTQFKFSKEIETLKVTNQKQSGRCWIFAGLNVLREIVAKKLNMENFEFSQNYTSFWDKFEKINYFLESIIDTIEEPIDSRVVDWIIQTGVQDGGQWEMFTNIVEKYGVVPKEVMPETFLSSNTVTMNGLLNTKLRKSASILRKMNNLGNSKESIIKEKAGMLEEFYSYLCICFGEPPKEFVWEYRDKHKTFIRTELIKPMEFFNLYIGDVLKNYVSIINSPTSDKSYGKSYTVKYLGNVIGGNEVIYINTDINTMKKLTKQQLKNDEIVWFGSDVSKYLDRDSGILDTEAYNYNIAFEMNFNMTKEERLDYRESSMNHAMVITGVNLFNDIPNRWKIENSWGDEKGEKGYFVMSDKWFDEYVYQVVINKKYLSKELKLALSQNPIVLNPWDPMGSLA